MGGTLLYIEVCTILRSQSTALTYGDSRDYKGVA